MLLKKLSFLSLLTLLFSCAEKDEKRVGIIQAVDHPALNATRIGVLDQLRQEGFIIDKDVKVKWESAQGNPSIASQIAQKFVGQNVDAIVTIGTMPSQSALQAIQGTNVPVVYASVTNPKAAKLDGNITGVTNYIDPSIQFATFKQIMPNLKVLGIVYNPGEANSVALLEPMQQAAEKEGIILGLAPASKTSDVYTAAASIATKVDAIFINNDNTALSAFDSVLKAGQENKKPVFVSDDDLVEKGAIAAIGPDQHKIGMRAGRMVAEILRTKGPASAIKAEEAPKPMLHINIKAAEECGIKIRDSIIREAIRVYS